MKLIFLGTSAAQPTEKRGLSCICLEKEGEILMFDAGEAAQIAYMKSGLGWNKKMKLFVTHLHGDHCVGILGLLQTMSMQNRTESLEIFGPKGIDEFLAANIKVLNFGLPFSILINIINEGKIFENKKYMIHAAKANHSITAFSYLFDEKDKPGRFNVAEAKELGIPEGELWNKLQNGEEIEHNGGKIKPEQVLGEKRPGKKIGISGEILDNPDEASGNIIEYGFLFKMFDVEEQGPTTISYDDFNNETCDISTNLLGGGENYDIFYPDNLADTSFNITGSSSVPYKFFQSLSLYPKDDGAGLMVKDLSYNRQYYFGSYARNMSDYYLKKGLNVVLGLWVNQD